MDDLDALLTPGDPPPGDEGFRELVWRLTSRRLRRQRFVRRAGKAAVAVAIYAAGLGTMWLTSPRSRTGEAVAVRPADTPPESPSPVEESSPVALEWQALESDQPRPDLYRHAGDLYLSANDVAGALRCYRSALRLSRGTDLEFNANDSWLLMTLKAERQKERRDARSQG
jgi:hypothetical protein